MADAGPGTRMRERQRRAALRVAAIPGKTDLHTHTTESDGQLSPRELVARAVDRGVTVLAVTDHDTTAGLLEARAAAATVRPGLTLVPGIELNCDLAAGQADVLGYMFDARDGQLQALLARIRAARVRRAREMVALLRSLGARLTYDDVLGQASGEVVARPHVARALVAAGFVDDVPSAFHHYIGRGRPAYVDRYRLTPAAACRALRAAGGVPALAHPVPAARPQSDPLRLRRLLPVLVEAGLGGLECYYPGYSARTTRWLVTMAHHFGLVPTGGSDYHGGSHVQMDIGSVDVPADTLDRLRSAV